jgi:hypothetical protein
MILIFDGAQNACGIGGFLNFNTAKHANIFLTVNN